MVYRDFYVMYLKYDEQDKPAVSTDEIKGIGFLQNK